MNELRAELERHRQIRFAMREDTSTEPIARLDDANEPPVRRQLGGSREPRRTGTDHDDIAIPRSFLHTYFLRRS